MKFRSPRIPSGVVLFLGVFLGWLLASLRPAPVHARAGDRAGESIVTTGPVFIRYDESVKAPIPLEAVYVLDYPFPCTFDAEEKRWDLGDPCTWDDVMVRWRQRGPRNAEMVALLQEEFHRFRQAHQAGGGPVTG